ncbi:glycoside hydrolase family 43 protein [Propionibacteriaceae bacterium G1746]|uniref:glycoside hydrolase family 43 protein n=1 Tax=Aestuariimicrobium sp. G57 TaxID=3418485 RepID=UPI003C164396
MTKKSTAPLRVLALLVATLGVAACSGQPGGASSSATTSPTSPGASMTGFTNPVYPLDFPDPQIIANPDGGYLAIATNGNAMNVQVLTSPDMVTWTQGTDALPSVAPWSSSGKVWAPEIIRWSDGSYRLYYTTKAPDPNWQCLSVATSKTVAGPYVDESTKPLMCEIDEGGSIDASPFIDSSGKAWLYWKNDGNAKGVDTWIKVAPLAADGMTVTGTPKNLFKQDLPWEGELVEGPALVEIDGVVHMFYSANNYGSDRYAVGHAVADSPLGPFTKDPEPVLATNDVAAGPGHNQLIKVGDQWWMVYHAWKPGAVGDSLEGRKMWLSTVEFNGRAVTVQPPTTDQPTKP